MVEFTRKGKRFIWSEALKKSFEGLKKSLVCTDVTGYLLNYGGPFVLDVDVLAVGIGEVFHQIQEGRDMVLAYASKAFNKAEKKLLHHRKRNPSSSLHFEYFRQYLLGRGFMVCTERQALEWLYRWNDPSGKTARWIEILSHPRLWNRI